MQVVRLSGGTGSDTIFSGEQQLHFGVNM